jgi:hypothetical protein
LHCHIFSALSISITCSIRKLGWQLQWNDFLDEFCNIAQACSPALILSNSSLYNVLTFGYLLAADWINFLINSILFLKPKAKKREKDKTGQKLVWALHSQFSEREMLCFSNFFFKSWFSNDVSPSYEIYCFGK